MRARQAGTAAAQPGGQQPAAAGETGQGRWGGHVSGRAWEQAAEAGFRAFTQCQLSAWSMLSRWGRGIASSLGNSPGYACAQGMSPACGWCFVDSSTHSACSHHHIHKMEPVRDTPRQKSTLRQLEMDVNPRHGTEPSVSLSPRQNSQLEAPCTLLALHPMQGRHQAQGGLF